MVYVPQYVVSVCSPICAQIIHSSAAVATASAQLLCLCFSNGAMHASRTHCERSVGVGGCLALFRQREVVANFENVWECMYTCSVYASSSLHRKALATHRYTFRCRAASNGVLVARARARTLGTVCCVSHQPFNSIKVAFAISLELEAHMHTNTLSSSASSDQTNAKIVFAK